ncbi:helix-turn-helix domain-containing protein [Vreelandella glaciei]|uniref:helix-turn-helix domain-containing protein n=1 Tax=Vreelandella glaciei TaxID=186761 RepID=UPI003001014F
MGYRQLTQTQRYQIHAYIGVGVSQRQVARALGIHNSTISRELLRNAADNGYVSELAQRLSNDRKRIAWKWTKRLPSMINIVAKQLATA